MLGLKITLDDYQLQYEKKRLRAIFRAAGTEVKNLARRKIKTAPGGGRVYYGSGGFSARYGSGYKPGRHVASRPGDPPASNTGFLAGAMKVTTFRNGQGAVITNGAFIGKMLELGAKGGGPTGRPRGKKPTKAQIAARQASTARVLLPRPYLTAALDEREASIKDRIQASIAQDIKFVKLKATAKP